MPLNPQDQQPIVNAHNAYRSDPAVNIPNLQWDSTLAVGAQTWADNLAATVHQLQHSDPSMRQGLGENIASATTGSNTPAQMVDLWGKTVVPAPPKAGGRSEQAQFKPGIMPNVSKDGQPVGHYTQMIWKTTTSVGCGLATDSTTGNTYLVCRYSPAGNMSGVGVPSPQPVTLTQVSVASATLAAGVDAANNVYYYMLSEDGTTWAPQYQITGKQMKQVSVADDLTICGLDTSGAIWQGSFTTGVTWTPMATGPSAFVSVGCGSSANIWAVGADGIYYKYNGSTWTKGAPGWGYQVNVASDGTVVGLGTNNGYYRMRVGESDWTGMDASPVAQLSCGSATNTWAVAQDGSFLNYPGDKRTQAGLGTGKQVSVASDGTVWSIGTDNHVSRLVKNAWTPLLV